MLEHLSSLLLKVAEQSKVNCMTESNIATCFAPILVRRQVQPTDMNICLEESSKGEEIVKLFILHHKYIFDITVSTQVGLSPIGISFGIVIAERGEA